MQHFPTYRASDKYCIDQDEDNAITDYREKWEVLSLKSTKLLGKLIEPRVVFSGHSHEYCRIINQLKVEEYTISSFNWRNKNNPKFLLVSYCNPFNLQKKI